MPQKNQKRRNKMSLSGRTSHLLEMMIIAFSLMLLLSICPVVKAEKFPVPGIETRNATFDDIIILTDDFPNTTVTSGNTVQICGTANVNNITIESGAEAKLINFPGNNTITIESDSSQFTFFRSGATVTFRGNDATMLVIPATDTAQSIIFNDKTSDLIIGSNEVKFDSQKITSDNTSLLYTVTQLTQTGGYDAYDNSCPKINSRGEIAFLRDMKPGGSLDHEIFFYSNGITTQISHNFGAPSTEPHYTNFELNNNGEIIWIADDGGLWFYSGGVVNQVTDYSSWTPDFNNNGQIVFIRASDGKMMQYDNGIINVIFSPDDAWTLNRPRINDSGQLFFEQRNVGYWTNRPSEIFLLDAGTSEQLTDNYIEDQYLFLSNGGQAVWVKQETLSELYYYDDGTVSKITNASNNDLQTPVHQLPDINDFGEVVWPSQGDIWFYSNGVSNRITTDDTKGRNCHFPRINNQGQIVWLMEEYDGSTKILCYYKGKIATIHGEDESGSPGNLPQINDMGQIIWSAYVASSGWEIFLATPAME